MKARASSSRVEIAALPAPVGPGAGEAVEDLPGVGLGAVALLLRQLGERLLVGDGAPQPGGNGILLDLLQHRRHAGLAEIFLGEDVGRHLRELHGHVDVVEPEDDGAVRIADLARRLAELDLRIGRLSCLGEMTLDAHWLRPLVPACRVSSPDVGTVSLIRSRVSCRSRSASVRVPVGLSRGDTLSCGQAGCKH